MTIGRLIWLIAVALLVLILNVASSFLYMVIYGHTIDPGHDEQYYRDHIQAAAPYCSIVVGIPLMFLAGWWVSTWWEGEFAFKATLTVWLAYAVIDIAIVLGVGMTTRIGVLVAISLITKMASVFLGVWFGARAV
jgi:hypothetical protein